MTDQPSTGPDLTSPAPESAPVAAVGPAIGPDAAALAAAPPASEPVPAAPAVAAQPPAAEPAPVIPAGPPPAVGSVVFYEVGDYGPEGFTIGKVAGLVLASADGRVRVHTLGPVDRTADLPVTALVD